MLFMFDLPLIIKTFGYLGLFGIIFAESGLFFGFFLPGDSIIFTAGFLASQGFLNIYWLCGLLFVAAVLGDNVGYWFGQKIGPMIFNKPNSFLFNKKNIEASSKFFEKYGGQSIILARFMPAVRTFTPIMAGVGKMNYRNFFFFNLIGGATWTIGFSLAGYFLGRVIPNIDHYILPIIFLIIIISVLPGAWQAWKNYRVNKKG